MLRAPINLRQRATNFSSSTTLILFIHFLYITLVRCANTGERLDSENRLGWKRE